MSVSSWLVSCCQGIFFWAKAARMLAAWFHMAWTRMMGCPNAVHWATGLAPDSLGVAMPWHAAHGIPRLVEKARGIEIGKQVRRGLLAQLPLFHSLAAHGRPHGGRVVPHRAGQHRRGEVPVHPPAEIRGHFAALPIDAVALDAGFAAEQFPAALRVSGHFLGGMGTQDQQTTEHRESNRAHGGLLFGQPQAGHEDVGAKALIQIVCFAKPNSATRRSRKGSCTAGEPVWP